MESEKIKEIWVGIFVVAGVIVLILGVVWGQGMQWFTDQSEIVVRFDNVRGLEPGDPVFVRGVKRGEVIAVSLKSQFTEVRLSLAEGTPLFSDVRFVIESKELMGGKMISVDPGLRTEAADLNRVYWGDVEGDPLYLMRQVEGVVVRIDSLVQAILPAIRKEQIESIAGNLEMSTRQLQEMIRENRKDFRNITKKLSNSADMFMEDSVLIRLGRVITGMDSSLVMTRTLLLGMNNEESTLGKLMYKDSLHVQLMRTSMSVDSLISDIRQNPKRYLHVSLF